MYKNLFLSTLMIACLTGLSTIVFAQERVSVRELVTRAADEGDYFGFW